MQTIQNACEVLHHLVYRGNQMWWSRITMSQLHAYRHLCARVNFNRVKFCHVGRSWTSSSRSRCIWHKHSKSVTSKHIVTNYLLQFELRAMPLIRNHELFIKTMTKRLLSLSAFCSLKKKRLLIQDIKRVGTGSKGWDEVLVLLAYNFTLLAQCRYESSTPSFFPTFVCSVIRRKEPLCIFRSL